MADIARAQLRRRASIALLAVLALTTAWTAASSSPQAATAATEPAADSAAAAAAAADRYAAVLALQESVQAQTQFAVGAAAFDPAARRLAPRIHETAKAPAPAKEKSKAPAKAASTKPASSKPASSQPAPTTHKRVYEGTNHFWIPSLGMSYGVHSYACGRTSVPLNYIYRWGCAGHNNVYLLGHAWGVMKPLHDLYVRGGLRVGMVAVFADAYGRVRTYRVTEWRVVRPTQIAWQIAAQPVPSMTLQTCVGKNSEYRLDVRLVAFK